jgi:hypothetical protein
VSKKGERSLQGIRHIDIGNVREVAARLPVMLDGATTQIGVYQDWKYDIESDYGTPYDGTEPAYQQGMPTATWTRKRSP